MTPSEILIVIALVLAFIAQVLNAIVLFRTRPRKKK